MIFYFIILLVKIFIYRERKINKNTIFIKLIIEINNPKKYLMKTEFTVSVDDLFQ